MRSEQNEKLVQRKVTQKTQKEKSKERDRKEPIRVRQHAAKDAEKMRNCHQRYVKKGEWSLRIHPFFALKNRRFLILWISFTQKGGPLVMQWLFTSTASDVRCFSLKTESLQQTKLPPQQYMTLEDVHLPRTPNPPSVLPLAPPVFLETLRGPRRVYVWLLHAP